MDLGLSGKHILITGGCQGIGLATAEEFLKEGASVCITGRNESKLQKAYTYLKNNYSEEKIKCFCGDATKREEIERLILFIENEWKRLDIVVPNIGSGKPLASNPLAIDEWTRLFETNLFGGVRLIDACQGLLKQSHGNIVMVSSVVSRQVWGTSYAYAASKNAVLSLVKYLAKDLAKENVRVNCVLPGNVFFEGGRWEEIISNKTVEEINDINSMVPMKRFGKPEEIAAGIVFLASSKASFITGSFLTIDGGQLSIIG